MPIDTSRRVRAASRKTAFLNGALNVFWSVLCLGPTYRFCAGHVPARWLYGFGALGLLPAFLPAAVIGRMAVSSSSATYRRLGVRFAYRFTQDGAYVRTLGGPGGAGPSLRAKPKMLAMLQRRTLLRERFHLAGLVFFLLLTVRAAWLVELGWAVFLIAGNIVYNVYPILMQQYVRLRLGRIAEHIVGRPQASEDHR